ncbi:uncharacterized protein ARMOST_18240 [Armillaria ostoyae]|uniref:Uncharacterized protein n=1 Tax=Armillaria ostoyae TaxID=47428 RepID=A0A284S174_ARMOS|nr:uncharacterized protein ARMOST_18240 [Armillaria ostoyae]
MAIQTNTPSDVSDATKALIFEILDVDLNVPILESLLQGIYTGIFAVTLWNIFMSKVQHIGRTMVIIIILLHIITTVTFVVLWSGTHSQFVDNGQSFLTNYFTSYDPPIIATVGNGIMAAICTILADSTMIWRCWIVWGRRWLSILPPVLLLISAIAFRMIATYELYIAPLHYPRFFTPYSSCVLATTLWCTLLIIYRIVTVARAGDGAGLAGGGLRAYRHVLEVLIESSALYSVSLILCTAFFARQDVKLGYFDTFATISRGIAPTLLVGRVAAGHARPDDSWQGSVISGALRFGNHVEGQSSLRSDLEAQQERGDEYVHPALTDNQKDTAGDRHRTLTGSQENIGIDLENAVGEDRTEASCDQYPWQKRMLEQALEWSPEELCPGGWSTDWGTSLLRASLFPQASANASDRGRTILMFMYRASDAVIVFHLPLGGGWSLA